MKKISLCLILVLIMSLACACSGTPKEATAICSECGNSIELYKKDVNENGCPVYSTAGEPCPDCVTKDVIDWVSTNFVCIEADKWQEFYDQYGDTEAYVKAESESVSLSVSSYYDIQERLSED